MGTKGMKEEDSECKKRREEAGRSSATRELKPMSVRCGVPR